jgi:hypothetical protein
MLRALRTSLMAFWSIVGLLAGSAQSSVRSVRSVKVIVL